MEQIKIDGVKRQTLNQRVYESIKEAILDGRLQNGTKLSESGTAKSLGVSATPVREAFRMLSMEGLVRIEPWKGAMVQGFSEDETLEVLQCREALEMMAMRLYFDKLNEKDIQAIAAMLQRAEHTDSTSEFVALSSRIHDIWIKGCGNKHLAILMQQLNDVLLYDRNISATDEARKKQIVEEHLEILNALRNRDLNRAMLGLNAHIQNGYHYAIQKHQEKVTAENH